MSLIPQSFLDDLLNRIDIVEVVDHRVKLKRSGKNYMACCPFHDEKTPSFTVSPDKQFYYCFGCGATGTAISFLMEYERSGFVDAVESLARLAGVEVPREERSNESEAREQQRKRSYDILEQAASHYQEQLRQHPHSRRAIDYLKGRGLSGHVAKLYGLGYAPPGWDNLLLKLGQNEHTLALLLQTGLTIEKPDDGKRYDRFRDRIMFPIRDSRGRVIGFGGRVLGNDKPKYLNSPETEVFHKGRELYGLYEALQRNRKLERLVVVEGYMDVIALAQYGLNNAVATLGTACGEEHLKLAFRHVGEIVFCFDGDPAGRNAAKRALLAALPNMSDGRRIRFLFLPEGQDPDSLVRQIGHERFGAQLEHAMPLEEFLFEVAADGIDLNTMDGRARFSKIAAPLIHQLPEGVFHSLMMENLARRTGLNLEILAEFTQIPEALSTLNRPDSETTPSAAPKRTHERQAIHVRKPDSKVTATPARKAMTLLLDNPETLQQLEQGLNLGRDDTRDIDELNLLDLCDYLRKRPHANFNNIVGYWGGSKGVEAQEALAKLVANHVFREPISASHFDRVSELNACFRDIEKKCLKEKNRAELQALRAKDVSQMNADEKARYITLVSSMTP